MIPSGYLNHAANCPYQQTHARACSLVGPWTSSFDRGGVRRRNRTSYHMLWRFVRQQRAVGKVCVMVDGPFKCVAVRTHLARVVVALQRVRPQNSGVRAVEHSPGSFGAEPGVSAVDPRHVLEREVARGIVKVRCVHRHEQRQQLVFRLRRHFIDNKAGQDRRGARGGGS